MCKHPVSVRCKTISHLFQTASDFSVRTLIYIRCAVDGTESNVFYHTSSEEVGCSSTMDDGHGHDSPYGSKCCFLQASMFIANTLCPSQPSNRVCFCANFLWNKAKNSRNGPPASIAGSPTNLICSSFDGLKPCLLKAWRASSTSLDLLTFTRVMSSSVSSSCAACHKDWYDKMSCWWFFKASWTSASLYSLPCKCYNYACIWNTCVFT